MRTLKIKLSTDVRLQSRALLMFLCAAFQCDEMDASCVCVSQSISVDFEHGIKGIDVCRTSRCENGAFIVNKRFW